jgi:hypothetical protein
MTQQSLINRLEAYLQEELQARERSLVFLKQQEEAIAEATHALERELLSNVARSSRRDEVFQGLGRLWNVPASAMTLTSIAERMGVGSDRLRSLRDRLRNRTADVVRQNRRIAALTRVHRQLVQDVLGVLFQEEVEAQPLSAAGTLIDAEA